MEWDLDGFVVFYVVGFCGIGYGLCQIIEVQVEVGVFVEIIVISGGVGQYLFMCQILVDFCGMFVVMFVVEEFVILGFVMLGVVVVGMVVLVMDVMKNMSVVKEIVVFVSVMFQVYNDCFVVYKIF